MSPLGCRDSRWCPWAQSPPCYLGLHVGVVVVLQQQRRRFGVVLPGGDVQRWQPHLALGVVLQQDGHSLVVPLLQCHSQRGETVLGAANKGCSAQPDGLGGCTAPFAHTNSGSTFPAVFHLCTPSPGTWDWRHNILTLSNTFKRLSNALKDLLHFKVVFLGLVQTKDHSTASLLITSHLKMGHKAYF